MNVYTEARLEAGGKNYYPTEDVAPWASLLCNTR